MNEQIRTTGAMFGNPDAAAASIVDLKKRLDAIEALSFENVFADRPEMYFDVNLEAIVAKDPDILLVKYSENSTAEKALADLKKVAGINSLTAVRENRLLCTQVVLGDPPSPLSVTGLEILVEQLTALDLGDTDSQSRGSVSRPHHGTSDHLPVATTRADVVSTAPFPAPNGRADRPTLARS
ncbi:MAG: hypothetical protein QM655_16885 [Nocardioidaceae bacterium]